MFEGTRNVTRNVEYYRMKNKQQVKILYQRRDVPQGQHFINRRFQSTAKSNMPPLYQVPQGRHSHLLKVSSLQDLRAGQDARIRRLKPTVNKVLSLRDFPSLH